MSKNHSSLLLIDYPEVQLAAVYGLLDLFTLANRNAETLSGKQIDVRLFSQHSLSDHQKCRYDAFLFPPNITGARGLSDTEILSLSQSNHQEGTIMCSVCAGAFWLGHTGILNNRTVTTHWALSDELQQAFPETNVDTDPILIDENDVITAGGLMAWLDMGLFLVRKWQGSEAANKTAKQLLVDPSGREQRNYRQFIPPLQHGDKAILSTQHILEARFSENIPIRDLAELSGISPRTFLRRFKKATNQTPLEYLQNLRLEKARGLLERTQLSINEIGWQVGYSDPSAFSRLFKQRTGLNAGEYRKRFRL